MSEWYAETDSDFNNYFDLKAHGVSAVFSNTLAVSDMLDIEGNVIKAAQNYNIVDVQPDGTGITILILQEN